MTGSFRVLVVEDDPEVTGFLRLVLLRTAAVSPPPRMVRHRVARDDPLRRALGRSLPVGCGGSAPSVLVVEEGPDELAALTCYFHHQGCTVIGVGGVERALAVAPDVEPDLIVIDPGRHGREPTARLAVRYPQCPIAVTTVLDVSHDPARRGVPSPTGHPAASVR